LNPLHGVQFAIHAKLKLEGLTQRREDNKMWS